MYFKRTEIIEMILLKTTFITALLTISCIPHTVFASTPDLLQARAHFSENKCAHSMMHFNKLNTDDHSFKVFVTEKLKLDDQVRIATCFERVTKDLSYYATLIQSIGKDQVIDHLLSKAEELSKEGEFHLASNFYLSAHRVNHLLDIPTHDEESLLTLAINSSIDANQLGVALKLLKEEQKTLYDPAQELLHYQQISSVYQMLGLYKQAEQALQHSLDSMQKLSKGLNTANLHFKMAQMAFKHGDDLRSEAHLKKAYLQTKKINNPMLEADIAYLQAEILIKQAKFDLALPLSAESLKYHQTTQEERNSPGKQLLIAERQVQLGNIYRGLEQFERAKPLYSQAAKTTESLLGKKNDHYAKVLEEELKMLFRQGKYQKADQLIAQYQQQNIPIFKRQERYGYE